MTRQQLDSLLSDIATVRIGVVGDFCLDAYWDLDPGLSEPSIETGLATRAVRRQRYSLGGAGNVVANLVAMGVKRVCAFAVVGSDPFGREMVRILAGHGVDTAGVLVQEEGWETPVYVKPIESGREQNRIDFGNANALAPAVGEALVAKLRAARAGLDLLVVNQQLAHGIHTERFRAALAQLLAERGPGAGSAIVDSRAWSDVYGGAVRKINDREALRLRGEAWDGEEPVPRERAAAAAEHLFARWGEPVFITRGARGMLVRDREGLHEVPGLLILGRIDSVGAGDAALAGIAAALAARRGCLEAAELGNLAAGVTVQKLLITGTASPDEIRAMGTDPDYVHEPELAADPRRARMHAGTEIEVVSGLPTGRRITHAIFDSDGTISTLREGWERIMEPMMIRAVLGEGWTQAEQGLSDRVRARVRDYIDSTTGVQTLVQMQGLVRMVREFAVVPAAGVKDESGYKAVYNEELLAMVRARLAKLERGELSVQDYTLKGSLELLAGLRAAGVRLYLASGTDQEDAAAEAAALGFARFFDGGIRGSVGDVRVEAKKIVIDSILAEIGGGDGIVVFGDGPVEIRETKKRAGYAVGVASDEPRRHGLNPAKRARLVRAGADLVVPDFTQWRSLLELFGIDA
jgi:bifunctional ADP-heptose synthase (sugar kinase/adenylyltransferase)/phosphoglycolate phosphatase-like HAD superfamily hydrolase